MTSFLIKRLRRNGLEQHMSSTPKNIVLVNLQPEHDLSPWTNDIESVLEANGTAVKVFTHDSAPGNQLDLVFASMEQHEGLNILVCSEYHPEWCRQSLLSADLVIVATKFSEDPSLYEIEKKLDLYSQSILNKKIYIVFLHEHESFLPQDTSSWLENRIV